MSNLKITVLVDNRDGQEIKGEWGLSLLLDYDGSRILLDAGLSGLFARNAETLGIDIGSVDYAVLSHAHDDHANGFETFFQLNSRAKLYVSGDCAENCYDRHGPFYKYAGIPRGIMRRYADRIVRARPDMKIRDGVRLLAHTTPGLDRKGLREQMYLRQGLFRFIPDDFRHEQSLIFELPEGIAVFNSCSHAGADVIIREAAAAYPGRRILAMVGGFHLFNKTEEEIRDFAGRVRNSEAGDAGLGTGSTQIYTGHCTGADAMKILKEELPGQVHELYTGLEFEL